MDEELDHKSKVELSVPQRVFSSFVEAVEADGNLVDVAPRLRKVLLETEDFTEASLKQALFGDAI